MMGAALAWAAGAVLTPPAAQLSEKQFTYITVENGTVENFLSVNTTAEWAASPVGTNQAVGTITGSITTSGAVADVGSVLFTVNLRPVVVAEGEVPAFRSLAEGTTGADVAQLQTMLGELGYLHGIADGRYQPGTTAAVKRWQGSIGVEETGVVSIGDIIFVPTLPSRLLLDAALTRGANVAGGEPAVAALPPSPQFQMLLSTDQADSIPMGASVELTAPDGTTWNAVTGARTETDVDQTTVSLMSTDDSPICREACGSLAITSAALLLTRVEIVPSVSGPLVPTAALSTKADGLLVVVDRAGREHEVSIVGEARGLAIVEGVPTGMSIRLGEED